MNGSNLIYQTGNHLGTGIGSDSNWASNTHNGVANNGFLGVKLRRSGQLGGGTYYDTITYTGNVIDSLYTRRAAVSRR